MREDFGDQYEDESVDDGEPYDATLPPTDVPDEEEDEADDGED